MPSTVIFDIGGVLLDWNPRTLYSKIFEDEAEMEWFLTEVCTMDWHVRQDSGRPPAEAVAELSARFPRISDKIAAFYDRNFEMISGPIDGTLALLRRLHGQGTPLFALSNWPRETFIEVRASFDFFDLFSGIVISGEEGLRKPDESFYRILLDRYDIDPGAAVFIDDVAENIEAAERLGIAGLHFTSPEALRGGLQRAGLL